ncbi:hypothetical protein Vretimale_9482 [Volvox reticuliferus]|uniref:Inward rectifier potassium channel C-terminal domain-containing protein n=1 Tax=Volvox reticuliferus TaxID=1737510 RepID=A0A8J4LNV3_9CHLO|nr:hypothetical protein Vretimale_9482 [Volvox reticuliferus]
MQAPFQTLLWPVPLTFESRFASPNKRSFTIRFSSTAVLFQRPEDGLWCLSFRLANIRKHSLINPQISLLFAMPVDNSMGIGRPSPGALDPSEASTASGGGGGNSNRGGNGSVAHFRFQELAIEDLASQAANLRLGLHAHINHIIRPGSPMFDRSLNELQALGAEVLCFMEGVDPMTSNNIQARHSYTPSDIRMNERFVPIELKLRGGELGLDFSGFDATSAKALAADGADEVLDGGFATFLVPVPGPTPGPVSGSGAGTGNDVEAGWSRANVPLVPLTGTSGRCGTTAAASASAAGPSSPIEVNTMMAVALSGDMRTHMQALRAQSIRSLTKQLLPLPQLVPSVAANGSGGNSIFAQPASFSAINTRASSLSLTHPLSPTAAVAGGGPAAGGFGLAVAPAAAALGYHCELRDLCDAVLTDVGSSAAVKRQAAALKEALGAMELLPRGPAELAGRQL